MKHQNTEVWAHRGFSAKYPENTLIAFEAAVDCGAHGIELDVHLSKDGALVVIHDERLERTTNGCGFVKDKTLEELQQMDAGAWFGEQFTGQRVPTLENVCSLVRRTPGLQLNVELKTDVFDYQNIEDLAWRTVAGHGLEERVIFSSFNHYTLDRLRRQHPRAHVGILYADRLFEPWRYGCFMKADALHPHFRTLTDDVVQAAHANGLRIHTWTVNHPQEMERLQVMGVDAIITDSPDLAQSVIRG